MTLRNARFEASRASNPLASISLQDIIKRDAALVHRKGERMMDQSITTEQRSNLEMDYQCVCGRRFTTERGMKIHRNKMGCLIASTNQQQRTSQVGKTSENQSQIQNHSAEESDEEFRQLINTKLQKINFLTASAKKKQ